MPNLQLNIEIHEGNEYTVVKRWNEHEMIGYRTDDYGQISIIQQFIEYTITPFVPAYFMKMILEHAELEREQFIENGQEELNHEIVQAIEGGNNAA